MNTTDIIALGAALVSVASFVISRHSLKKSEVQNTSNETQKFYDEWFSIDFYNLRKSYRAIMQAQTDEKMAMTNIDERFTHEEQQVVMKMVFFFDKVGWLSQAKLINTHYIIGPMHSWVISTYKDFHLIIKERRKSNPIYCQGFEKLVAYSVKNELDFIISDIFPQGAFSLPAEKSSS